jgi:hypothetical protein
MSERGFKHLGKAALSRAGSPQIGEARQMKGRASCDGVWDDFYDNMGGMSSQMRYK